MAVAAKVGDFSIREAGSMSTKNFCPELKITGKCSIPARVSLYPLLISSCHLFRYRSAGGRVLATRTAFRPFAFVKCANGLCMLPAAIEINGNNRRSYDP